MMTLILTTLGVLFLACLVVDLLKELFLLLQVIIKTSQLQIEILLILETNKQISNLYQQVKFL